MKEMILLFTLLVHQHVVHAEDTQFEKLLKSNSTYRNMVGNISSTSGSSGNSEKLKKITTSLESYIKARDNAAQKSKSEVVNQFDVDNSNCTSCPGFINLTSDMTKIIDRLGKGDKIADANQAVLDSNHLNFLYYTVKSELGNGRYNCQKFGNFDSIVATKFEGNFKYLTEQVFDLPNINEVQYIPKGSEEIVYFYRGSGTQKNMIIEAHIKKDGKAHLIYYNYTPSGAEIMASKPKGPNPIDMILDATKKTEPTGDNYLQVGVGVQTGDHFLPNNLNLLKAKTTSQLTDGLVLKTNTSITFNHQTTEMALANNNGENWVVVNANNQTQWNKQFVTTVPMSINIDSASALKLGATVKDEVTLVNATKGSVDNARTITLDLTDHNNQYLNFEVYNRDSDKFSKITVSNQINTGVIGQVGLKYEDDNTGVRTFSLQQSTSLGDYGKLSTEFGTANGKGTFVGVKHEVAFGEETSLSLSARVGDSKQTTMLFQFKTKF